MTHTGLSMATLYSSAQCVLSVVGSIGVILLFAGIPQLIYSDELSVSSLMTFLLGVMLISIMVAGNSLLNCKYRQLEHRAQERRRARAVAAAEAAEAADKPPSYDAIISSDGLPPDYFTVQSEKPPRYEEIAAVFPRTFSSHPTLISQVFARASSFATPSTSHSTNVLSEFLPRTSSCPNQCTSRSTVPAEVFTPSSCTTPSTSCTTPSTSYTTAQPTSTSSSMSSLSSSSSNVVVFHERQPSTTSTCSQSNTEEPSNTQEQVVRIDTNEGGTSNSSSATGESLDAEHTHESTSRVVGTEGPLNCIVSTRHGSNDSNTHITESES